MAKLPWRFQGDIAYGETDPLITVFLGEVETDEETGVVAIRQDIRNPVTMRLSELPNATHLANPAKMQVIAARQKQERQAVRDEGMLKRDEQKGKIKP